MVFSSAIFLAAFLPITFILYYLPFGIRYKNTVLVITSMVFYAFGEPVYVFLMAGSVLMNYIFGVGISANKEKLKIKKLLLALSVILNVSLLGVFKYAVFFAESLNGIFNCNIPVPQIALPIGISFFTFQAMSYVIDVYRDPSQVQKSFPKLLLYISFFPQLIAGPIVRYHDIDKQLSSRPVADAHMIVTGMQRFIKGLAKKMIIANTMAVIVDKVYGLDMSGLNGAVAWMGAIAYVFQIYFDFSGYSDMAIGLARMFGFEFLENFDHPYSALTVKEFWRRWHISLSTWFREYVYIPLGGNRKGKLRTEINKIIVFFLTGFWHGANWTFIIWGLFHGFFLILEDNILPVNKLNGRMQKEKKKTPFVTAFFLNIYTMLVVITGFVFFRADDIGQALIMIKQMFTGFFPSYESLSYVCEQASPFNIFIALLAFVFSFPVSDILKNRLEKKKYAEPVKAVCSICLLVICIMSLASAAYNPFIYFRF